MKNKNKINHNENGFAHLVAVLVVVVLVASVGTYVLIRSYADSVSGTSGVSASGHKEKFNTFLYGSTAGNILVCKTKNQIRMQASVYIKSANVNTWFDDHKSTKSHKQPVGVHYSSQPIKGSVFNGVIAPKGTQPTAGSVSVSAINNC